MQRAQEDLPGLLERKGTSEQWLRPPDTPRTPWPRLYSAEDSLRQQSLEEKNVGKKESSGRKGSEENKSRMGKSWREGKISPFISEIIIKSRPLDHVQQKSTAGGLKTTSTAEIKDLFKILNQWLQSEQDETSRALMMKGHVARALKASYLDRRAISQCSTCPRKMK